MSGTSSIQWTDATWNPVVGCARVSAGCDHCYAFQLHDQRHVAWKRGRWPSAPAQYHQPFSRVQLMFGRLEDPLRWRTPRRVFVNSMSDLFHPGVPDEFIEQVFDVMELAHWHTFQVLTKRPERMRAFLTDYYAHCLREKYPKPWRNVWLGVSVEDQAAADARIPLLLQTPAAVRFISAEPLLGPVTLDDAALAGLLDWVIVGGESGPHARPMELGWARSLRDQCAAAAAAFFMKQLGSVNAQIFYMRDRHGADIEEWRERHLSPALDVREWPRSLPLREEEARHGESVTKSQASETII